MQKRIVTVAMAVLLTGFSALAQDKPVIKIKWVVPYASNEAIEVTDPELPPDAILGPRNREQTRRELNRLLVSLGYTPATPDVSDEQISGILEVMEYTNFRTTTIGTLKPQQGQQSKRRSGRAETVERVLPTLTYLIPYSSNYYVNQLRSAGEQIGYQLYYQRQMEQYARQQIEATPVYVVTTQVVLRLRTGEEIRFGDGQETGVMGEYPSQYNLPIEFEQKALAVAVADLRKQLGK